MPKIEVKRFRSATSSAELWASFHACRRATDEELRPGDPVLSDAEFEIEVREADPLYGIRALGRLVWAGRYWLRPRLVSQARDAGCRSARSAFVRLAEQSARKRVVKVWDAAAARGPGPHAPGSTRQC